MALFWGSSRGGGVAGAEPSPPVVVALRRVSQNPEGTGGFFCPSGGLVTGGGVLAEPPFQRWGATRRTAAVLPTPDVSGGSFSRGSVPSHRCAARCFV